MNEHEYQAARAATIEVRATPEEIFQRYRELRGRYLYSKEYLYYCLGALEGKRVLDLGCEGAVSVQLAKRGADVVGVDLAPELIDVARRQTAADGVKATFVVGDTARLTVSGTYDVVVCKSVLHHVDIRNVLSKILRYVRPDGGLVAILQPIALSGGLRRLRLKLPIPIDASPDEHPLTAEEFRFVTSWIAEPRIRYSGLFGRLARFTDNMFIGECLAWLDLLLLTAVALRHFSSVAVIVGSPRAC